MRLVLAVLAVTSIACLTPDERGCVRQSVAECVERHACVRFDPDAGTTQVGYEVGPLRTFVSCEVDSASCETRALEACR